MALELKHLTKRVGAETHIHETDLVLAEKRLQHPVGHHLVGQDDLDAADGRHRQADLGRDLVQRRERDRRAGAEAQRRHGVSAVHQLSELHGLREHRLTVAGRQGAEARAWRARRAGRRPDATRRRCSSACRASSPAASSSGWRSPAPWSRMPSSSCSTSRSPISTTSCARSCATSCRSSSPAATARSSTRPRSPAKPCSSAAISVCCTRAGSCNTGRLRMIYRKPESLLAAQVFSDPPINTAAITKRGDRIVMAGGLEWHVGSRLNGGGRRVVYHRDQTAPHPTAGDQGTGRADQGPGSGHRDLGLGKRDPFRSRRPRLGLPVSRRAPARGRRGRAALCRCRPRHVLRSVRQPCRGLRVARWRR